MSFNDSVTSHTSLVPGVIASFPACGKGGMVRGITETGWGDLPWPSVAITRCWASSAARRHRSQERLSQARDEAPPRQESRRHRLRDRFKEVDEAYEVLKDGDKRAAYDRFGHAAFEQGGGGTASAPTSPRPSPTSSTISSAWAAAPGAAAAAPAASAAPTCATTWSSASKRPMAARTPRSASRPR